MKIRSWSALVAFGFCTIGLSHVHLAAAPAGEAFLELGPLLGHVGPKEAKIWAKASVQADLSLRIGLKEDLSDGRDVKGPRLETSSDFMEIGRAHV